MQNEIREQLQSLETAALENFIANQSKEANLAAFMAHGFSLSARAMERHLEKRAARARHTGRALR